MMFCGIGIEADLNPGIERLRSFRTYLGVWPMQPSGELIIFGLMKPMIPNTYIQGVGLSCRQQSMISKRSHILPY